MFIVYIRERVPELFLTIEINRTISAVLFLCIAVSLPACGPREPAEDKKEKIQLFLRKNVTDTMEEDYHRHNILTSVRVTGLTINKISVSETSQDIRYLVVGKVSYVIKGERIWTDREGNTIVLAPEQEITHWFSAGVLEDKYIGVLLRDEMNRLTFYADNPA